MDKRNTRPSHEKEVPALDSFENQEEDETISLQGSSLL